MKTKTMLIGIQSLVLVLAVLLSSAHAKDLAKMQAQPFKQGNIVKPYVEDGSSLANLAKLSSELHPHVDKQTLKTFYQTANDAQQQADRRSLWPSEKTIRPWGLELRLGASLWLRMVTAKMML